MRTLVVNLGNTSLFAGVYAGDRLVRAFRVPAREALATAAAFERLVARHVSKRGEVTHIALCSVVPKQSAVLARRLKNSFGIEPRVFAHDSRAHGLRIGYHRPRELGLDRLAAALGARQLFPRTNVVVVDCGTATTVTALTAAGEIAGGAILPGYGLWAEMLAARTAQLPRVDGPPPRAALGRGTRAGIASGLHFGHAGAVRELVARIAREAFGSRAARGATVVGTGGNAPRFFRENLFAHHEPRLILAGLYAFAHA